MNNVFNNREKRETHEKVLFPDECYVIQGAISEVYREIGCGFLEPVYQECLERELRLRQVPFEAQREITLTYKGETLSQTYRPNFICHEKIIVELKAVKEIAPEHKAQLLNYLKATGLKLGLLINFGSYPKVEIFRAANTNSSQNNFLTAKHAKDAKKVQHLRLD